MYREDDTLKAKNAWVNSVQSGVHYLQFCCYGFHFLWGWHLKSRK